MLITCSNDTIPAWQVSVLHTDMVRWLVQMLLWLAPNKEGTSEEAINTVTIVRTSVSQLNNTAKELCIKLQDFSHSVSR